MYNFFKKIKIFLKIFFLDIYIDIIMVKSEITQLKRLEKIIKMTLLLT